MHTITSLSGNKRGYDSGTIEVCFSFSAGRLARCQGSAFLAEMSELDALFLAYAEQLNYSTGIFLRRKSCESVNLR